MKILYFEKCFMFCQHAGKVLTICTLERCRLSTLFFFFVPTHINDPSIFFRLQETDTFSMLPHVYFFSIKQPAS